MRSLASAAESKRSSSFLVARPLGEQRAQAIEKRPAGRHDAEARAPGGRQSVDVNVRTEGDRRSAAGLDEAAQRVLVQRAG